MPERALIVLALGTVLMLFLACASDGDDDDSGVADLPIDDDSGDGDADAADDDGVFDTERFASVVDQMGFLPYLDLEPTRQGNGYNGYTRYYFDQDELRCYNGVPSNVAISPGNPDNIMFFMEGGGATWPGYWLGFQIDFLFDMGYRNRDPENPFRDWTLVYVPYCDNSLHLGDNEIEENGRLVQHYGLRLTTAAAKLVHDLYPDAKRVLVTGSSAGGMGTYVAWPIVKYLYPDARTYIVSDSGVGFWNPNKPDTWELMKTSWNIHIPQECERCQDSTIQTWLYDLMLEIDPQLRVGMFSSWHDGIITGWFLHMDPNEFAQVLGDVTDEIKAENPERFSRFLIAGNSHTCYTFLLPEGPNYMIDGVSLYQWMWQEVIEDPIWDDHLDPVD